MLIIELPLAAAQAILIIRETPKHYRRIRARCGEIKLDKVGLRPKKPRLSHLSLPIPQPRIRFRRND
jgi:hypothetical protein